MDTPTNHEHRPRQFVLAALVFATTISGCESSTPDASRSNKPVLIDLLSHDSGKLVDERWDAHFVRGAKAGHRHTQTFRVDIDGQTYDRIVAVDSLEVRRFGNVAEQQLTTVSLESTEGKVLQLAYELKHGEDLEIGEGQVNRQRLSFVHQRGDTRETQTFNWTSDNGGLFAVERSLQRHPMRPDESRTVDAFLPLFDRLAQFELTARQFAETSIGAEKQRLLRIESKHKHAQGWNLPTVYWVDAEGVIQKVDEAFMDRVTELCTKEQATRPNDLVQLDVGLDAGVRVSESFAKVTGATRAVYRVKIDGVQPSQVFASGPSQQVVETEDGCALITVTQVLPDVPTTIQDPGSRPTQDDMAPNRLIQSDDRGVRSIAIAVTAGVDDPWLSAMTLEQYLHRRISKLDFSQVFSSAAEVAVSKRGDCTEHAVLLAATCRASNIPARVAVGLLYSPQDRRMLYHMWNEIWIHDRWVPMDATLGTGGIGASHIKFRDSSLAGESPYGMLVPVLNLIGRLEIELVEAGESSGSEPL